MSSSLAMLRRFIARPHRLLALEAAVCLLAARAILLFVPFRVLAGWFGKACPPDKFTMSILTGDQEQTARMIGRTVTGAARYLPVRAVCLPQAIAAKAMMNRRHLASVIHFGVAKQPNEPFQTHAWLESGGVEITGFPQAADFVELVRFV